MSIEKRGKIKLIPATTVEGQKAKWSAFGKAMAQLKQGEIGHLDPSQTDFIGCRVMTLDGQVSKDIILGIKSIDWNTGIAVVDGGKFGELTIQVDQLRRIDAVFKKISDAGSQLRFRDN